MTTFRTPPFASGWGLSRRGLFQALGGAAVAASLASTSRVAYAQARRPTRLVILFTPHGAPAEHFWPKSITDLSATAPGSSILSPLQRHAGKLNVLRGINYLGSDNHPAIHDALTNRTGTSIDTLISKKLGVKPLRLGVVPDYTQSFTVDGQLAFDAGTALPHVADPVRVFDGLVAALPATGTGGTTGTTKPGPTAADLRRLALGVTNAELDEMKLRIGTEPKLDKHIGAIRGLTATPAPGATRPPPASCTQKPQLASVEKMRGKNVWAAETFPDVLAAQMDIAALALRCGLTRVVSIQCGYVNNQIPFSWIGINDGHHNVSHSSPGSPGRVLHARCQEWYATQLAKLMDSLDVADPEDPAHTMLENTVILWSSELADGQAHNCQGIPIVLAGGGGGYFKTGQYLQLQNRSHAGILLAICESMGVTGVDMGNGSAEGVLREVKA